LQRRDIAGPWLRDAPNAAFAQVAPPPLPALVREINHYFAYLEALIADEGVDLVLAQAQSIAETVAGHIAMARDIPITFPISSRDGARFMWASDPYLGHRRLQRAYDRLPEPEPWPAERIAPPAISAQNVTKAEQWRSVRHLARLVRQQTVNRLIWLLQDLKRGRKSKRLPYLALLRQYASTWWMYRVLDRLVERDVAKVTERPYVLFLLQLDPEWTVLSQAKEFSNVAATLRQLAVSLPAGYNLVVKEHVTSIGNRPAAFYRALARLPNVVLADFRIRGIELAMRAAAVSTFTGTVGVEATLLGKPVILFSTHTEYGFLPNVSVVISFHDLPAVVRDAVRVRTRAETDRIRRAGSRYKQAVAALSWDAPEAYELSGRGTLDPAQAERAVDLLIEAWREDMAAQSAEPVAVTS
jgi:hypothetical protein